MGHLKIITYQIQTITKKEITILKPRSQTMNEDWNGMRCDKTRKKHQEKAKILAAAVLHFFSLNFNNLVN